MLLHPSAVLTLAEAATRIILLVAIQLFREVNILAAAISEKERQKQC